MARTYAVSLAMIVANTERAGEPGLRAFVHTATGLDSARAAVELWERAYPKASYATILDALALKLFGVPTGPELDLALRAAVCCSGMRSLPDLTCRGAQARDETTWFDASVTPRAVCHNQW